MPPSTAEVTQISHDACVRDSRRCGPELAHEPTGNPQIRIDGADAARHGWFYGWLMLPLATLMMISTSPGQTFGVTYFNEKFLVEFGLSKTGLSTIYLVATLAAAMTLTFIGGLIDRYGLRVTMFCGFTALAGACVVASQATGVATLFLAFFMLRTFGPGTMTLLANNTLAAWFDSRLGLASSISQITMAVAWATVPAGIVLLIDSFGWRGAYLAFAAFFAFGMLPLMAVFYRQSPADIGQIPDGLKFHAVKKRKSYNLGPQFTVREAMRQPAYWILLTATAVWSLVGTGLVFHLVALFQAVGLESRDSARAIGTMALVMGLTQLGGGVLADRLAMRWLLIAAMSLLTLAILTVADASGLGMLVLGFAIFGCGQGLMTIISTTAWARFFGRAHLGKIRGTSLTAAVGASAIGPVIMGASADYLEGFGASLILFAAMTATLGIAAWWATPPKVEGRETRV